MANKNFIDLTINFGIAFLNSDLHELEFPRHGRGRLSNFPCCYGFKPIIF
ncbi:hypothetical protein Galf_1671 [Gallionella capsiferriformans ES-2]|uniref:Uncharacterized protein n=1 Tax=Gallionella capsiferriformans (strain ES-2) TaxID=395494 RepID=D9SGN6_GALCS|nr:hypothetical protein Galf_1671 [Gallionella capsiferriformans ES-2]